MEGCPDRPNCYPIRLQEGGRFGHALHVVLDDFALLVPPVLGEHALIAQESLLRVVAEKGQLRVVIELL